MHLDRTVILSVGTEVLMGAFWDNLNIALFFCPGFLLKVFPICSSDKKDHNLIVPLPRQVLGPNWLFFLWELRCRVVTWAARVWDVIHRSCYERGDFQGVSGGILIPWSNVHLKLLIPHFFPLCSCKKLRKKEAISPVIQDSLNTNMLLLDQAISVALSCLCASPLLCISAVLCRY